MNRISQKLYKLSIYAAFTGLFLCLTACINEYVEDNSVPEKKGKLTLHLKIPGSRVPVLRSMDGVPENEVKTVDVLFFKKDNQGVFRLVLSGNSIYTSGVNVNQEDKTVIFEVNPVIASGEYNLVIVANARQVLENLNFGISEGTAKNIVIEKLELAYTDKWNTANLGYTPIPMMGEPEELIRLNNGSLSGNSPVKGDLVRMLARIDVNNNANADFTLQKIHLCNYNTVGRISPALDSDGYISRQTATTPHLPADPGKITGAPLTYEVNGAPALLGEIYTFESDSATDNNGSGRRSDVCLVLEGDYKGQRYFYRVDFCTGNGDYMPLLRNYKHEMRIMAAEGIGYPTFEEALAAYTVPSNLKMKLVYYDEGKVRDIVFNGQYMLGVNNADFSFNAARVDGNSETNELIIYTDYPGGWEATVLDDMGNPLAGNWLKGIPGSGSTGTNSIHLRMAVNPCIQRIGYIHFQAGRLEHRVKVTQNMFTDYHDLPNCYILSPGNMLSIPVVKAYRVWENDFGTTISGNVTAELIWQDTQSLISSVNTTGQGEQSAIHIKANGTLNGNAVIAVKVNGTIRWSWHIWVTDYDPDGGGNTYTYRGRTFMDRNLGAMSTASGSISSVGLFYQWGRKDPFVGSSSTAGQGNFRKIYKIDNSATNISPTYTSDINIVPYDNFIPYSISNPATFLYSRLLYNYDWYYPGKTHDNSLWGEDSHKSIYDPSPVGWRVPQSGQGNNSPWNGLPYISFNNGTGITWPQLGYYPAAGKLVETSGELSGDNGKIGRYWTATSTKYLLRPDAFILYFNRSPGVIHDYLDVSYNEYRAAGLSVRSEKE